MVENLIIRHGYIKSTVLFWVVSEEDDDFVGSGFWYPDKRSCFRNFHGESFILRSLFSHQSFYNNGFIHSACYRPIITRVYELRTGSAVIFGHLVGNTLGPFDRFFYEARQSNQTVDHLAPRLLDEASSQIQASVTRRC